MLNSKNRRATLLVAAGLIFGATTWGWLQHLGLLKGSKTTSSPVRHPSVAAARANTTAATGNASAPAATTNGTAAGSSNEQTALVNPAVSGNASAQIATQTQAGTAPAREQSAAARAQQYYPMASRYGRYGNGGQLMVPPPPMQQGPSVAPDASMAFGDLPPPPVLKVSFHDAVKLVGLVDGKAIFSLQKAYAREHNLPTSFTLGAGQQYNGIKVESVSQTSATISDGKSICVKDLGPIN